MAHPAAAGVAVVTSVVLWASAFPGIRAALDGYGSAELAAGRYLVASTVMIGALFTGRVRVPPVRDVPGLFVLGALGFTLYNLLLNTGQQTVTAGAASLLISTVPLFTALLAAMALKERLHRRTIMGIAVAFVGAALIAVGEHENFGIDVGALFVLGAAGCQAAYFVIAKWFLERYRPLELTCLATWAGTILLLPWSPALGSQVVTAPLAATLATIYLGVLPAAVAYVTWSYALSHLPAGRASTFLYTVPVLAIVISWIWLGEIPSSLSLVGGVLALAGVGLAQQSGR